MNRAEKERAGEDKRGQGEDKRGQRTKAEDKRGQVRFLSFSRTVRAQQLVART